MTASTFTRTRTGRVRRGVVALEMMMIVIVIFCFGLLASSVWQIRKADITIRQESHRDVFAETVRFAPDLPDIPDITGIDPDFTLMFGLPEFPEINFGDWDWDFGEFDLEPPDIPDPPLVDFDFWGGSFPGSFDIDLPSLDPPDFGGVDIQFGFGDLLGIDGFDDFPSFDLGDMAANLGIDFPPAGFPAFPPNLDDIMGLLGMPPGLPDIPLDILALLFGVFGFDWDDDFWQIGPRHVRYYEYKHTEWLKNPINPLYYNIGDFSPFVTGGDPKKQWRKQDNIKDIDFSEGTHDKSRHLSIHSFSFSSVKGKPNEITVDPYAGPMGEWEAFELEGSRSVVIGPCWTYMPSPVVPTSPVMQFKKMRKWYKNGLASALDQSATSTSRSSRPTQNDPSGFRKKLRLADHEVEYPQAWE